MTRRRICQIRSRFQELLFRGPKIVRNPPEVLRLDRFRCFFSHNHGDVSAGFVRDPPELGSESWENLCILKMYPVQCPRTRIVTGPSPLQKPRTEKI